GRAQTSLPTRRSSDLLLYFGFGIRTLVFVYCLSGIGSLLIVGLYVRKYLPEVHINPFRARIHAIPEIFSGMAWMRARNGLMCTRSEEHTSELQSRENL